MCMEICANICVQISANSCIIRVQIFAYFCIMYLQQAYMCISTELLQMRLHLYVTSYLTKCDGSLPSSSSGAQIVPQQVNLQQSLQLTDWMVDHLLN